MLASKELSILFIYNGDGKVTTKLKPLGYEYTETELFMAFKQLEAILNDVGFDWTSVGDMDIQLNRRES